MLSNIDIYFLKLRYYNLILSPLESGELSLEDISTIRVHSANMLDNESENELKFKLREQAERRISHYLQDKHYIPKLLIAAFVFLLVYFFMSLVVRDPLPIIDEIIIALALATITFVSLSKRDVRLARESLLLHKFNQAIESYDKLYEDEINNIEDYIYTLSSKYSIIELSDILSRCNMLESIKRIDFPVSSELKEQFSLYLLKSNRSLNKALRSIKEAKRKDQRLSATLVRLSSEIDLYLLAFLYALGV